MQPMMLDPLPDQNQEAEDFEWRDGRPAWVVLLVIVAIVALLVLLAAIGGGEESAGDGVVPTTVTETIGTGLG